VNGVFERDVVAVPVGGSSSSRHVVSINCKLTVQRGPTTYLFSKKVFALLMFFPMALAFHAQKLPEGSIW
jgi:hypothetical protein